MNLNTQIRHKNQDYFYQESLVLSINHFFLSFQANPANAPDGQENNVFQSVSRSLFELDPQKKYIFIPRNVSLDITSKQDEYEFTAGPPILQGLERVRTNLLSNSLAYLAQIGTNSSLKNNILPANAAYNEDSATGTAPTRTVTTPDIFKISDSIVPGSYTHIAREIQQLQATAGNHIDTYYSVPVAQAGVSLASRVSQKIPIAVKQTQALLTPWAASGHGFIAPAFTQLNAESLRQYLATGLFNTTFSKSQPFSIPTGYPQKGFQQFYDLTNSKTSQDLIVEINLQIELERYEAEG